MGLMLGTKAATAANSNGEDSNDQGAKAAEKLKKEDDLKRGMALMKGNWMITRMCMYGFLKNLVRPIIFQREPRYTKPISHA